MTQAKRDELDAPFDMTFVERLDLVLSPLRKVLSPRLLGAENLPNSGGVLLAGNHSIYGLELPMVPLEIWRQTGRHPRGLADRMHFSLPGWRDFLRNVGAVVGSRDNCGRLLDAGEAVLVFPGGAREVAKRRDEAYELIWKERIGFARMAIEHQVPIVPMAVLGIEDMFDIWADADDMARSRLAPVLRKLGLLPGDGGEKGAGDAFLPPLSLGTGPAGSFRPQRLYIALGEPVDTSPYKGAHEDREACLEVREQTRNAIESQLDDLRSARDGDPGRYPAGRIVNDFRSRIFGSER
jgi:1-acyl-sn-glycerol-3-phosphate acyltransferase